ncbi:MAG TPA: 50S ribosomal protein L23 [Patescibacteria group bacterium]|nr:50S ribosomal protein L23 [Patescibacteria group bacterium]
MIKPIFTEKSLKAAKTGKYSFWVGRSMAKNVIKSEIAKLFGVHVTDIKTMVKKGETGRNMKGVKFSTAPQKKAVVTLGEKEKIDIFEESKK